METIVTVAEAEEAISASEVLAIVDACDDKQGFNQKVDMYPNIDIASLSPPLMSVPYNTIPKRSPHIYTNPVKNSDVGNHQTTLDA